MILTVLTKAQKSWTRDTYIDSKGQTKEITVKAIGVWDTVGTLGIPPAPIVGIQGWAEQ